MQMVDTETLVSATETSSTDPARAAWDASACLDAKWCCLQCITVVMFGEWC